MLKHGNAMALEAIVPNYTAYPILEKQSYCLEKLFKLYVLFKRCRFDRGTIVDEKPSPTIARKPILIKRKSTNM
jgi:hypothetical protein